ncbi:uncharacterized protein [Anabrus simplex]|uniref:uncharacterized protein n=1 Tax=Anabrus simplex TaxID=316456 RepID=UPI0035A3B56B
MWRNISSPWSGASGCSTIDPGSAAPGSMTTELESKGGVRAEAFDESRCKLCGEYYDTIVHWVELRKKAVVEQEKSLEEREKQLDKIERKRIESLAPEIKLKELKIAAIELKIKILDAKEKNVNEFVEILTDLRKKWHSKSKETELKILKEFKKQLLETEQQRAIEIMLALTDFESILQKEILTCELSEC